MSSAAAAHVISMRLSARLIVVAQQVERGQEAGGWRVVQARESAPPTRAWNHSQLWDHSEGCGDRGDNILYTTNRRGKSREEAYSSTAGGDLYRSACLSAAQAGAGRFSARMR
jgi:hypothetical protein